MTPRALSRRGAVGGGGQSPDPPRLDQPPARHSGRLPARSADTRSRSACTAPCHRSRHTSSEPPRTADTALDIAFRLEVLSWWAAMASVVSRPVRVATRGSVARGCGYRRIARWHRSDLRIDRRTAQGWCDQSWAATMLRVPSGARSVIVSAVAQLVPSGMYRLSSGVFVRRASE